MFISVIQNWELSQQIVKTLSAESGLHLTKVLFAGATIGLSSAIAYRVNGSCGGIDIISFSIAMKKGSAPGKYNIFI